MATERLHVMDSKSNVNVEDYRLLTTSAIKDTSGNEATVNSDGQLHVVLRGKVDTGNSTTSNLVADGVFTGTAIDSLDFGCVTVLVHSDQSSADGGLLVQYSADGSTDWHTGETYTILANATKFWTPTLQSRYMRIVYTNGSTATTDFHMETVLRKSPIKWSSHNIEEEITDEDDAELTKSVLTGKDPNGTYRNVNTTLDGDLTVSDNSSGLAIAEGKVSNTSAVRKFGYSPDFDYGDGEVTVWDGAEDNVAWENMRYDYSQLANIDSISSSDNTDAEQIIVEGLDHKGLVVSEKVTLNGQTRVALTNTYRRVYRAYNNNGTSFSGHVVVYPNTALTSGVPTDKSQIRLVIHPDTQQTEMAVYTIPDGYKGYLRSYAFAQAGASKTTNYIFRIYTREYGKVLRLKHRKSLSTTADPYQHFFDIPLEFIGGTDIEVTCELGASGTTAAAVSADFDIILVDQNDEWEIDKITYRSLCGDTGATAGSIHGISFSETGDKMYVGDVNDEIVYEYDLSNAWDPSSFTYNSVNINVSTVFSVVGFDIGDMWFKPDGTELYVINRNNTNEKVHQATLSTPWDLSTATDSLNSFDISLLVDNPRGIVMSDDGTRLFLLSKDDNEVTSYTLSTPWDISTATSDSKTLSMASKAWESATISIDGTRLYVGNETDSQLIQYNLSTAFDLDTAVLTKTLDVSDDSPKPRGLYYREDGNVLFIGDGTNDQVCRWSV